MQTWAWGSTAVFSGELAGTKDRVSLLSPERGATDRISLRLVNKMLNLIQIFWLETLGLWTVTYLECNFCMCVNSASSKLYQTCCLQHIHQKPLS
jgi:hypothetical protein